MGGRLVHGPQLSWPGVRPAVLKAITASEPDPGGRLPAMVATTRDKSPELADAVMAECVATLPATSSEVLTYVELTYRGRILSRQGDQAAILAELARKVPGLVAMLQTAGGGSVEMVTPEDLAASSAPPTIRRPPPRSSKPSWTG